MQNIFPANLTVDSASARSASILCQIEMIKMYPIASHGINELCPVIFVLPFLSLFLI